ncbi:hypothetical protein CIPAW_11G198700 [Carya illinoinensis]|uniref:Uncharacterized protein n=1 Tax=Carya illinoinensis TaxID=32201 RepID=A0A8T1P9S5_CARIL|nr:hypothetical protein CIPAW_11G198700 [Carya illinoinensis]
MKPVTENCSHRLRVMESSLISHEHQHPLPKTADPEVQISGNFALVKEHLVGTH